MIVRADIKSKYLYLKVCAHQAGVVASLMRQIRVPVKRWGVSQKNSNYIASTNGDGHIPPLSLILETFRYALNGCQSTGISLREKGSNGVGGFLIRLSVGQTTRTGNY
jgi:hypothetical protein